MGVPLLHWHNLSMGHILATIARRYVHTCCHVKKNSTKQSWTSLNKHGAWYCSFAMTTLISALPLRPSRKTVTLTVMCFYMGCQSGWPQAAPLFFLTDSASHSASAVGHHRNVATRFFIMHWYWAKPTLLKTVALLGFQLYLHTSETLTKCNLTKFISGLCKVFCRILSDVN